MVVIGCISLENLTQTGLAKDDDVMQAFSTDRANQPLGVPHSAKVSAAQSGDPNAHRRKTPSNGETIGGIAVAYEMSGRTIPWEGLGNLAHGKASVIWREIHSAVGWSV